MALDQPLYPERSEMGAANNDASARSELNGSAVRSLSSAAWPAAILDQMEDIVVATDAQGRLAYLNRAAETVYGIASNDAVGRPVDELFRWCWPSASLPAELARTLESDGRWHGQGMQVLKDGRRLTVEGTLWLQRDAARGGAGTVAILRPVPVAPSLVGEELKREPAPGPADSPFRLALQGSPVIVYTTDRRLRYTWIFNPHRDFQPEMVLGKRDDEFCRPEEVAELVALKQEALDRERAAFGATCGSAWPPRRRVLRCIR
jgi:PAS domain S-box-containing protein